MKIHLALLSCAFIAFAAGCGGGDKAGGEGGEACDYGQDHSAEGKADARPAPPSNQLATPRESMMHQFALLKAGKLDELKACLTPRLRERVTQRMVEEGAAGSSQMTFEDLYDSETMDEYEGLRTCKVKMKNGRTLTTLVLHEDKWLADTIWFR